MAVPHRPAHPTHGQAHAGHSPHPAAPPKPKAQKAVLEITRSDNGDATYRLLIDDKPHALKASTAHWDDASPWPGGNYGAAFQPLHGKTDAFLIEYPPGRSAIKFHNGTVTAHSEGCIVTAPGNIAEIEKALADVGLEKNKLRFDVKGNFPIGFKLSGPPTATRGGTFALTLELTGGGAPGGVSKDIWFHLTSAQLTPNRDYTLVGGKDPPVHTHGGAAHVAARTGAWLLLAKGDRSVTAKIELKPGNGPTPAVSCTFSIDTYKIVNAAPGKTPYYYTPSDYKTVLGTTTRLTIQITAEGPTTPFSPGVRPPHHR